ncbi:MAG TPA: Fur family transcriptional regulator [Desulfobacteria bacterium]|nr:Fur family transcriptional regulator [Desulfobacteria bacterium]
MSPLSFDSMREKLHKNAYKITSQRETILRAFMEIGEGHLSAEDVYRLVKAKDPDIGLATVYRTLDLLAELDILQKMDFGDGRSRYEFCKQTEHHHHHLVCLRCHQVAEFDDDLLESLEGAIAAKDGFKIVDHDLKFYGYCRDCQDKS